MTGKGIYELSGFKSGGYVKNCALLVKSMKFCMERPFYVVNGCRYGATKKTVFSEL